VRDIGAMVAFALLARAGVGMRIDLAGKVSSGLNMVTVAVALGFEGEWINWVFAVAVVVSVLTAANYVRIAIDRLRSPTLT
jgi:phosphatidylglycerophosphate synthase